MKIKRLVVGYLSTNSYIVYDEIKKEGIVIDPGDLGETIEKEVKMLGINLKYIVFTHVHFDHILAYPYLKEVFPKAKLLLSHKEEVSLTDRSKSLLDMVNIDFPVIRDYEVLKNDDEIKFGDIALKVIETPGHTEGSICLYGENTLFSGDTLFLNSMGRWDFPGGNFREEVNSICNKLFKLPYDTVVYSGHGDRTTIGFEIENNEVSGWI